MLGRVAAVVFTLLGALPVLPQCNFTPVRSAQFRSSALDLALDGNDLWVATSYGVSLYDRRMDPPKLLASVAAPGITRVVRAQNGIAYAGSGSSLVVVQKSGRNLQIARTIDAGGMINDLAVAPLHLYVASTNGLAQYDLVQATNPVRTLATFTTSRTAVSSLALMGFTLYAADGDSSIEAFDIAVPSNPQLAGAVAAPSAVNFIRATGNRLCASSGALSTFVFAGSGASLTNVGTAPFGTASLAPLSGDVVFAGGNDRRLRAVDFSVTGSPVEVFRADLPPTSGTINRIAALASSANRLYIAGGDMGLQTYDITGFLAPFAMRAYSTGGGSSVISLDDKVYLGRDSGGVTEFSQSNSGGLTQGRSWDGSRTDTVWDGGGGFLLTSSGSSATMWTLLPLTPQVVAATTFRAPVVSAVLIGTVGYAVLSDRTLWSANFAEATPVPAQITIDGITPSAISRSGSSIVLSTVREDGNTALTFFATPQFTESPRAATVPGVSVTRVTLSNSTAAVLTFQGITLVDFAAGTTTVLPQSVGLARSLVLNGTTLYQLTDTALIVWDLQTRTIARQYTIPADPIALHVAPSSTIADIATGTGIATVATAAASRVPSSVATPNANAYYRKVVVGGERIDLFDGRNVDIYNQTLRFIASLRDVADVAADGSGVYAVTNGLVVSSHTADGIVRGSFTLSEGADAQPLSIRAVGGAVWVSLIRGCSTFACEKKTIVFDPRNGVTQTGTFPGAVVDAVISGNRAYALTDLPSEIRVLNVSDPFHPSTIVSASAPQAAVSISYRDSALYVLGEKLTAYAESTLTPLGEILGSYVVDPSGAVTPADQRVRIDGNCAVVTGRSFSPQLFTITSATSWTPAASFSMPSATRSIATTPGVMHFLTDHSLETWSTTPLPKPPRRQPAR